MLDRSIAVLLPEQSGFVLISSTLLVDIVDLVVGGVQMIL